MLKHSLLIFVILDNSFLVPALIDKMNLHRKKVASSSPKARSHWRQHPVVRPIRSFIHRFPVYFSHYYRAQIRFLCNWKKLACLILVLAFGLPIFLLPEKIEPEEKDLSARDSLWIARYNEFAPKFPLSKIGKSKGFLSCWAFVLIMWEPMIANRPARYMDLIFIGITYFDRQR